MTASERIREARSARTSSKRYLTFGRTRTEMAEALIEYRAFVRDHPDHSITPYIDGAMCDLLLGIREQREIDRKLDV